MLQIALSKFLRQHSSLFGYAAKALRLLVCSLQNFGRWCNFLSIFVELLKNIVFQGKSTGGKISLLDPVSGSFASSLPATRFLRAIDLLLISCRITFDRAAWGDSQAILAPRVLSGIH